MNIHKLHTVATYTSTFKKAAAVPCTSIGAEMYILMANFHEIFQGDPGIHCCKTVMQELRI
jgi:hypothetical protein